MGRLVSAVVLFYALEKLAVLLAVPLLLGAAWLKYKVHRMDGDKWDRYFRAMPNRKYAALFFVFYTIPLLAVAGVAFLIYRHFQFPEPALTALLLVVLGELRAVRKLDDHKAELWAKFRKLDRATGSTEEPGGAREQGRE